MLHHYTPKQTKVATPLTSTFLCTHTHTQWLGYCKVEDIRSSGAMAQSVHNNNTGDAANGLQPSTAPLPGGALPGAAASPTATAATTLTPSSGGHHGSAQQAQEGADRTSVTAGQDSGSSSSTSSGAATSSQLQAAQRDLEHYRVRLARALQRSTIAERALNESRERAAQVDAERKHCLAHGADMQRQVDALTSQVDAQEVQLLEANTRVQELETTLSEVRAQASADAQSAESRLMELQGEYDDKCADLDDAFTHVQQLASELDEARAALAAEREKRVVQVTTLCTYIHVDHYSFTYSRTHCPPRLAFGCFVCRCVAPGRHCQPNRSQWQRRCSPHLQP